MRTRRRFLFGAALVGGAYIAYTVYRQQRQLQELFSELFGVATVDASEEARAREHFAETQRECERMLARELPKAQQQLARLLNTDACLQSLRVQGKFDQARWNELKLVTISRALAEVYVGALFLLKIRIHINIIARHYLAETAIPGSAVAAGGATRLSEMAKARFLRLDPLCVEGLDALAAAVRAAVDAHIGGLTLDSRFSCEEVLVLLTRIRGDLEEAPPPGDENMQRNGGGGGGGGGGRLPPVRAFLLRTLSAAGGVAQGDQLQALLSEVQEILVSEPFHLVLDDVLRAAFDELGLQLRAEYDALASPGAGALPTALPIAKLIPRVRKLAKEILKGDLGNNSYALAMGGADSLADFCWLVYAGWCDHAYSSYFS